MYFRPLNLRVTQLTYVSDYARLQFKDDGGMISSLEMLSHYSQSTQPAITTSSCRHWLVWIGSKCK